MKRMNGNNVLPPIIHPSASAHAGKTYVSNCVGPMFIIIKMNTPYLKMIRTNILEKQQFSQQFLLRENNKFILYMIKITKIHPPSDVVLE